MRTMQPALLAKLLRDPAIIASRLVNLRAAFPAMDVAKLGALSPQILLQVSSISALEMQLIHAFTAEECLC